VRCWRDGCITDAAEAVDSPQSLSTDPDAAARILQLVPQLPLLVWGRDESNAGEMWNSNSVTAWLLERAGIAAEKIQLPDGGRATSRR